MNNDRRVPSRRNWLRWGLFCVALALIAIGVRFLFTHFVPAKPQQQLAQQLKQTLPQEEFQNYLTYNNPKLGLSLKIPDSWRINEQRTKKNEPTGTIHFLPPSEGGTIVTRFSITKDKPAWLNAESVAKGKLIGTEDTPAGNIDIYLNQESSEIEFVSVFPPQSTAYVLVSQTDKIHLNDAFKIHRYITQSTNFSNP